MNLGRNVNTHIKRSRGSTPQGLFFLLKNVSLPPPPHALFQSSSHSLSYSKSLRRKEPLQLTLVYPDYSFHKSRVLVYWLFLWQGKQEAGRVRDATFPATPLRTQVLAQTSLRWSGVPFIWFWVSLASRFPTHTHTPLRSFPASWTQFYPGLPSQPHPASGATPNLHACPSSERRPVPVLTERLSLPTRHPGCRSPEARPSAPPPQALPQYPVSVGPAPLRVSHSPLPRSHP